MTPTALGCDVDGGSSAGAPVSERAAYAAGGQESNAERDGHRDFGERDSYYGDEPYASYREDTVPGGGEYYGDDASGDDAYSHMYSDQHRLSDRYSDSCACIHESQSAAPPRPPRRARV